MQQQKVPLAASCRPQGRLVMNAGQRIFIGQVHLRDFSQSNRKWRGVYRTDWLNSNVILIHIEADKRADCSVHILMLFKTIYGVEITRNSISNEQTTNPFLNNTALGSWSRIGDMQYEIQGNFRILILLLTPAYIGSNAG